MERNFEMKKFLNYAALKALSEAIKASSGPDAADDLSTMNLALNACFSYVNSVDVGEAQIQLASIRFEGEEYREMVVRYDTARRRAHEAAIANTRMLNRLASLYGIDKIFTGNDQERLEVADFCLDVTVTLFENRRL